MAVQFKVPNFDQLVDGQYFSVPQANGLLQGYMVDKETRTLYAKESQIIVPSHHGMTHVAEDLVPSATCDSPGLMSPDDKCKLDSMLQMRVGVLGFQGAGFPDDGGFITGDLILAAGSEFISIERIGNTVRFNVDSPLPLNCGCETCAQIFWIQDETATRAIRAPSCNGVLPDVNVYGELKVYSFPESTIVDPKDPSSVLNKKGQYPSLIFKRYTNAITPFESQFEMVLKRNSDYSSHTGWSFTPGSISTAQCVWFMGKDNQGGQLKFEFFPEQVPGLLGSVLYNGNLLTKKMAVIVDYDPSVLSNNKYILRLWDVDHAVPIGDRFTATNVWRYLNPENSTNTVNNPKKLVTDATVDVLPVGSLVDIWEFELSRTSDSRVARYYFSKQPELNPLTLWSPSAGVRFGDLFSAREEVNNPQGGTAITASEINVPDKRVIEKSQWGINNFEERFILSDDGGEVESCDGQIRREPSGEPINNDIVADIDPTIPGLRILRQAKSLIGDIDNNGVVDDNDLQLFMCAYGKSILDSGYNPRADFNNDGKIDIRDLAILGQQFDLNIDKVSDRPIFLWHRGNHKNAYIRALIGQPDDVPVKAPPYDILLRAPVDSFADCYMKVLRRGVLTTGPFAGAPFIVVKGLRWEDIPSDGVIRILTGAFRNSVWHYYFKTAFSNWDDDGLMLIGRTEVFPFDEDFPIGVPGSDCVVSYPGTVHPITDISGGTCGTAKETPTNTTVVELLRQDYSSPCVRLQFAVNNTTGAEVVQLQVKVGFLDMSLPYELNTGDPKDDLVRGLAPGYTVSKVMLQNGFIADGIGQGVTSSPSGFRCYTGGELPAPVQGQVEKWNEIEIMLRDNQVWVWWNGMIVPPDTVASANLPAPTAVNTPYFPISSPLDIGKVAFRMFPGAIVRQVDVKDQLKQFSEFTNGQLQIIN